VYADEQPDPIRWTDGHICFFFRRDEPNPVFGGGGQPCEYCGQKAYGYPHVSDIASFMKRKRKMVMVILCDKLLPVQCAKCGKPIEKGQGNRADIYPGGRIVPMHYECAWGATLGKIYGAPVQMYGVPVQTYHSDRLGQVTIPEQNPGGGFVIPLRDAPEWIHRAVASASRGRSIRPVVHVYPVESVNVGGSAGEHHFYHNDLTGETMSLRSGWSENLISSPPIQQALAEGLHAPIKPGQSYLQVTNLAIYGGGDNYSVEWYVHPSDTPKVLPPTTHDLTEDEKLLLQCTKSYKSSYQNIRDYRGYEARRKGMKGRPDDVRASLRAKGLMDNRNALTIAGRNAAIALEKERGYVDFLGERNPRRLW
jgi:hypothetical protein